MIDLSCILFLIFCSCSSIKMAYPLHPTFSFEDPTMLAYANLPVEKSAHPSPKATTIVEEYELASRPSSPAAPTEQDPREAAKVLKKAYRKVDIRLLAWYTIVLVIMGIENTSIAKSAIMNVEAGTDIKHQLSDLTDVQWAHVVGASFYTSLLFQPLSALFLKRCTPRIWIGGLMLMWAVIAVCTCAVQNFSEIFVCRLLLGMESGLMPAIIFHISFWYPADILPLRIALCAAFYMSAGCVSSLLIFAIAHMNGVGGLPGWRWLFILLGLPTLLCAVYTLCTLPNYPQDAKFLTAAERDAILANLPETQPSKHDKAWDCSQVKALFKEPSTYTFLGIWICHPIGALGIVSVLPTAIYELGISNSTITQLMAISTSVFGSAVLFLVAWLIQKDKLKPWLAAAVLEAMCGLCYIVLMVVSNLITKYIFITLSIVLALGVLPILFPQRIRATDGATWAAIGIGMTTAMGSLGGIVGPHVYLERFAPSYRVSYGVSLGLVLTALILILVTKLLVARRFDGPRVEEETDEA
jgi:hypothetical protein